MFGSPTAPAQVHVGIIRTSSIGDVVLASACLDMLRHLGAGVQTTWIGKAPALELVKKSYSEVNCVGLDDLGSHKSAEFEAVIDQLKGLDLIVDLQLNIRSRLLCRKLKEQGVATYTCKKNLFERTRMLLSSRFRKRGLPLPYDVLNPRHLQYKVMIDGLLGGLKDFLPVEAFEHLGGLEPKPSLFLGEGKTIIPLLKEMKFGRWLAVAPGAAHATKQAPVPVIMSILEKLLKKHDASFSEDKVGLIFLGSESEQDLAYQIIEQISWPYPVLNLTGKLNLEESSVALRYADTVLTNDSGLAHIAESLGTPVSSMFGPTVEGFGFAPWRSESRAFSVDIGCRPCSKHGKASCRYGDSLCFYKLDTDEIAEHLLSNLSEATDDA